MQTILSNKKEKNDNTPKLYSFDIFDTLVTRRCVFPKGIFLQMQMAISDSNLPQIVRENFTSLRINIGELASACIKQKNQTQEVCFDYIYKLFKLSYGLTEEEINFLKQLEIDTEIKNLVPIKTNLNKLKQLIKEGKKVVLISDMYFSEQQLSNILSYIDPIFKEIKIYVSSDNKTSKYNKKLFEIIQTKENISYQNWEHTGDNLLSDIENAASLGIHAKYFPQPTLMSYEKYLLASDEKNIVYKMSVGAAISARQTISQKQNIYNFGASFAAPILYNYVEWVIAEAQRKGYKTLYFVARDGYIPKIIADLIIQNRNLDIKTKYIYGSRKAWKVFTEGTIDDVLDSFFNEFFKDEMNIDIISYRIGLDKATMTEFFKKFTGTEVINRDNAKYVLEKIKKDKTAKKVLLELTAPKREIIKSYLFQEVDTTEQEIAFVELVGSGKTQDCIAYILNKATNCKITTFYMVNVPCDTIEYSQRKSYFAYNLSLSACWLELICRAPHGQTLGYKKEDNKYIPEIEEIDTTILEEWGYAEYIEGIKSYAKNMLEAQKANNTFYLSVEIFRKYYEYLDKNLDIQTANILGAIPFIWLGREERTCFAAPPYSFYDTFKSFVLNKKLTNTNFYLISYNRSSSISKFFLKLKRKYGCLRKLLFDIQYSKKRKKHGIILCILGIKISFLVKLPKNNIV